MDTFLLTWNPKDSSVEEIAVEWKRVRAGRKSEAVDWSCGSNKSLPVGSRVFLHRQRVEPRGIVASGWVVRASYEGDHWDDERAEQGDLANYVDWMIDAAVDGFGDDTVPDSLAVHRVSRGPIHDQITWNNMPGSGIRVPPEAAAEIERLWALHLGGSKVVPDQAGLTSAKEGWIEQRLARSRYRENGLRDAKIAAAIKAASDRRLRCEVPGCGFCFEEVYGDPGKGFAHVHHLNVLSGSDEPIVTTLADLAIVCANCHAMIHRGGECRPLQGLLKRSK